TCMCSQLGSQTCPRLLLATAANTELYTLSLHDALPILFAKVAEKLGSASELFQGNAFAIFESCGDGIVNEKRTPDHAVLAHQVRSEEHTSELQSLRHLVCRLLLEKKNAYV